MKPKIFSASQFVPRPRAEVFAFFSDHSNLARITPPEMGFVTVKDGPGILEEGARYEYRVRVAGVPVKWVTLIEEFDPPRKFADVQLRGPYAYWRHTHAFEDAPGGTLVKDEIVYRLPLGALGAVCGGAFAARTLARVFAYRKAALEKVFGKRA